VVLSSNFSAVQIGCDAEIFEPEIFHLFNVRLRWRRVLGITPIYLYPQRNDLPVSIV
jgi:hypothetical protein